MTDPILSVRDLRVTFSTPFGPVPAVRGLDLDILPGESLAIVGESGSGKSVTMMAMLGLLPNATVSGSATFRGTEMVGMQSSALRRIRGNKVSMIFQDPMTSLNPVLTIGRQMSLVMRAHQPDLSKKAALARAVDLLDQVAISQPAKRVHAYPHELSGGMRQRVMIAMAISNDPEVLIADEPTTALDVTVQAQIMDLLGNLRREHHLALVLITHDLGVVAGEADRVAVMYAGRVVERGSVTALFADPGHPYTRGLLECLPRLDARHEVRAAIPGVPASPQSLPPGCPFAPRCRFAVDSCSEAEPELAPHGDTMIACSVFA
ncbi:MAG TPA: ABC transporter ATP-binding protein [Ilumatobacteraceae bacterium]|nr:ABC transporter ATP-binding protein [Ilumatobacteraceae bacterium]HRB02789.1 ABC transporter ATP-binding protein [Ilumatobacteraceae bacterium]